MNSETNAVTKPKLVVLVIDNNFTHNTAEENNWEKIFEFGISSCLVGVNRSISCYLSFRETRIFMTIMTSQNMFTQNWYRDLKLLLTKLIGMKFRMYFIHRLSSFFSFHSFWYSFFKVSLLSWFAKIEAGLHQNLAKEQ